MGDKTGIARCDATWNPVSGCSAERVFPRAYNIKLHLERLHQPLHWRKPRRIFVKSDLFNDAVPAGFIEKIFRVMEQAKHHTFQVLTKRPARMFEYMTRYDKEKIGPPPKVWLGISCEDQVTADERIPLLLQTPAAVRFISAEPLLGPIDLTRLRPEGLTWQDALTGRVHAGPGVWGREHKLDWVIAGGESGPNARPSHTDWFISLRNQCIAAQVQFFFKQWGEYLGAGQDGDPNHRPFHVNSSDAPIRIGKKAAGRLLDGREWNEFPS